MAITLQTAARNAAVAAVAALIDAGSGPGTLEIGSAGFAATLAILTMNDPAFGAPTNGTVTANAISSDTNTTAGTAAEFRIKDSDSNIILSGTVGESAADIIANDVDLANGGSFSISALTLTQPAS